MKLFLLFVSSAMCYNRVSFTPQSREVGDIGSVYILVGIVLILTVPP